MIGTASGAGRSRIPRALLVAETKTQVAGRIDLRRLRIPALPDHLAGGQAPHPNRLWRTGRLGVSQPLPHAQPGAYPRCEGRFDAGIVRRVGIAAGVQAAQPVLPSFGPYRVAPRWVASPRTHTLDPLGVVARAAFVHPFNSEVGLGQRFDDHPVGEPI